MPITFNIVTATDKELKAQLACYGWLWDPRDQVCSGCGVKSRCLGNLARQTLPQLALENRAYEVEESTGKLYPRVEQLDLESLAVEMQSSVEALTYALQFGQDPSLGMPVIVDGQFKPSMLPCVWEQQAPSVSLPETQSSEHTAAIIAELEKEALDGGEEDEMEAVILEAEAPKKRGRPKKIATDIPAEAPKKRGRPKKIATDIPAEAPKKRGRPKKIAEAPVEAPKKRGRPKKIATDIPAGAPKKAIKQEALTTLVTQLAKALGI